MATCNGAPTLGKVLAAYCRLRAPASGWSLCIVDDGSSDGTGELLMQYRARLPLTLLRQARCGKSAALNAALAHVLSHSVAELFVFTDDDATPDADWLLQLEACAAAHPAYALFGASIAPDWAVPPPGWVLRTVPLGLTFGITNAPDGPVFPGLLWGANMAVRRAVFEAGHRFDPAYGPRSGSYAMGGETEFTRRVAALGYRAWFCAGARVHHHIRAHQLESGFIFQRAFRFGRGAVLQEGADDTPRVLKVARWRFAKLGVATWAALAALLRGDGDALRTQRWEIAYLRGYIYQSWFGKPVTPPPARRVLIASCSGELGGMEWRMAQEARVLAAAGIQSMLASTPFDGLERLRGSLQGDAIDVSEFDPPQFFERWPWRRSNKLRARWSAARQLRSYRADLVHVALCWTSYGATLLWLAHHCRLPSVISVHNAFPPTQFHRWHERLYAQAFSTVKGIYAVSPSAMQHFLAVFNRFIVPSTKLSVIPNSVDTQRFFPCAQRRSDARRRLGVPADALLLGAAARLSIQKRPSALLALFCALRPRFPDLHLVFIGSGGLEEQLRQQARAAGVLPFVHFSGFTSEVELILPALDLHVLMSRNEGFGIATIEAMACGVPALGTDVPGTADILRDSKGGLLLPLADAARSAELVGALLADPPRRAAMGIAGRAEVERLYTPAIMKERLLDFYAGLV
ncbi:MAG: glycosyltransferase [Pseudomonadota bacterium]